MARLQEQALTVGLEGSASLQFSIPGGPCASAVFQPRPLLVEAMRAGPGGGGVVVWGISMFMPTVQVTCQLMLVTPAACRQTPASTRNLLLTGSRAKVRKLHQKAILHSHLRCCYPVSQNCVTILGDM